MNSLCDETGSFTLTSPDNAIAFSHPSVDGRKYGDRILALLADDCHAVRATWTANREFTIAYPKTADVEFAVAKIRGTTIRLRPE